MHQKTTYFGIAAKADPSPLSNRDASLTQALIERRKWKRKWWHPRSIRLEGYQDPWSDKPI